MTAWLGAWFHRVVLRHNQRYMHNPHIAGKDKWLNMHRCSCGVWWVI